VQRRADVLLEKLARSWFGRIDDLAGTDPESVAAMRYSVVYGFDVGIIG
jgi:hypothetical protein